MNDEARRELAAEFSSVTGRPVRWATAGEGLGDFEDRENTLEVFDVQDFEQRTMFSSLRALRRRVREQLGRSIRVVFHTPQATTRYYAGVRPVDYQVPFRLVPPMRSGQVPKPRLVDDDVLGDSRPPRSKVA